MLPSITDICRRYILVTSWDMNDDFVELLPPGVEPPVPPQVNAQAGDQQQRQQAHNQQQYGARQQMLPFVHPGGWAPCGMVMPLPPAYQIKLPQIW